MSHGFEMFFGFALTVLTGYVLGQPALRTLLLLVILWLGGRIFGIFVGDTMIASVLTIGFALVFGWHAVRRFRHAKKWRNRSVAWILAGITLMPLLWYALHTRIDLLAYRTLPTVPLLLFALIMAFMGGRIIAPAAAGEINRQGGNLEARVQPGIEGGIIVLGGLAIILMLVPKANLVAGAAMVATGLLLVVRLTRWRLWRCLSRPDLVAMAFGYAWLAAGFVVTGLSSKLAHLSVVSIHLITIGALGTLSTTVMLLQAHRRWLKAMPGGPLIYTVMSMIAIAAIARTLAALQWEWRTPALWVSSISWSIAYVFVLVCLLTLPRKRQKLDGET